MNEKTALKHMRFMAKHSRAMRLAGDKWPKQWQTLIAIMLSAQARDEVTIPLAEKLFKTFPTLERLASAKLSEIKTVIRSLNFFNNKAKNVLACTQALVREHNGVVPMEIDELVKLPGVGRKTANVFVAEYGKEGIGVDTHVFYISRYLGWTNKTTPDKVEHDLKKLFQKKYWSKVNPILVRFGKTHTSRKKKDMLLDEAKKIV